MVKITYKTGDKVFAKVKGYPPWPARVEGDTGKKKYNVLFYGTQETGAIKPEDLCYYSKNRDSYVPKYLKRAGYEDAVKQIEEAIKKGGGDGNDGTGGGDDLPNDIDVSDTSSVSSISEKKAAKRKVTSLPDEPVQKKIVVKPRRRSVAIIDSKEDLSEEPAPKKPRRKSNSSNVVKDENEENIKIEPEIEKIDEDETESEQDKVEKVKEESKHIEESNEPITESDTEKSDSAVETKKETTWTESKKDGEERKKPKEADVEIENNADSYLQMEEEAEKAAQKVTFEIVTEQMLNNNILYAEKVRKNAETYRKKPVDDREDNEEEVLAVKLPSGTICGIKLHKQWPIEHINEYDRALYDEQVAKSVLEIKHLLTTQNKAPNEVDAVIIHDIQMTLEDIKELTYGKDIESKRRRLDRLKKEADLVLWDSRIKNNLGLDKALPEAALECLKDFHDIEKDLDVLMLKKHPHVLDTVRRLRKYVGNIKEWEMNPEDMDIFTKQAEKIRTESEKIFSNIKTRVTVDEEKSTFWETFMDLVSEFRIKCKGLSESEILVLCAEPDSRQAFLDKLDEVAESEIFNSTKTIKQKKRVLEPKSTKTFRESRILEPWTKAQKKIVLTYFKDNLIKKISPKKNECVVLKEDNPDMFFNKSWKSIKCCVVNTYIKNVK